MKVSQFITLYKVRLKNMEVTPDNVIKIIEDLIHPKTYVSFDNTWSDNKVSTWI